MAVEVAQEVKLFGKWSFDDVEVSSLLNTSSIWRSSMRERLCMF